MTEKDERDALFSLNAYAPSKVGKNDVKNSSKAAQKIIPLGFALGFHALFLWWLNAELQLSGKFLPAEIITVLDFIEHEPPEPKPVEVVPETRVKKNETEEKSSDVPFKSRVRNQDKPGILVTAKKKNTVPLNLYDQEGRIRLPVDFIERLDEANVPGKRFDFQNPDLALAGTFLKRPPVIEFNPTQFEDAWKPDQDVLTELLEKAVEKTTKEIKIPVPGNPTVKLVCKVSVLALGGGCGFVPNGGYGRVIADNEDDPETLSPEEDKECQAWWEKISDTRSQREWLKTKELYELTCKKPLAKEKP